MSTDDTLALGTPAVGEYYDLKDCWPAESRERRRARIAARLR